MSVTIHASLERHGLLRPGIFTHDDRRPEYAFVDFARLS